MIGGDGDTFENMIPGVGDGGLGGDQLRRNIVISAAQFRECERFFLR
jgi:hypothetical protein